MKLLMLALALTGQSFGAYGYYRSLTIDHTKVGSSPSTSFSVLVSISTATSIKLTGSGGRVQHTCTQTGGVGGTIPADLVFSSDSAGSSKYPWEVSFYDGAAGTMLAWVQVPTVSNSANTVFYMAYGDASVSTCQNTGSYSPANAWNANYKGVWHMEGATSLLDSTGVNNLTAGGGAPTLTAGKVGGCADFTSGGGWYYKTPATGIPLTGQVTMSAWLYSNGAADSHPVYFGDDAATLNLGISENSSGMGWTYWGSGIYTAARGLGSWNWFTFVYDLTAKSVTFYVNGALDSTHTGLPTFGTISPVVGLGAYANGTSQFQGAVDEVRISAVAESADWILTEYNNQNAPGNIGAGNFITYGAETAGTASGATGGGAIIL
jgi:hypothetical protein